MQAWKCRKCGRSFRHARQWHSCRPPVPLETHFAKAGPAVRQTFDTLLAKLAPRSAYQIDSAASGISLRAGGVFAAFKPRKAWLDGELLLDAPQRRSVFQKVWQLSARSWVHGFRLQGPEDVTPELVRLLREALSRAVNRNRPPDVRESK